MKSQGSSDAAVVEFVGRVQRMARIHQEGLSDKPNRFSREVDTMHARNWGFVHRIKTSLRMLRLHFSVNG